MTSDAGYVYVIGFSNGTVKVGKTKDTGQRLSAHKSDGRKFGIVITGEWVSPLHAEWEANEDILKKIAADLGGTALRAEYFSGVDYEAVVEQARELPFTPPAVEAAPPEDEAAQPPAPPQEERPPASWPGLSAYQQYRMGELLLIDADKITRKQGAGTPEAAQMIAEAAARMAAATAHAAIFGADPGQVEEHERHVIAGMSGSLAVIDERLMLRFLDALSQRHPDGAEGERAMRPDIGRDPRNMLIDHLSRKQDAA